MKIRSQTENMAELEKLLCILYKNLYNTDKSLIKLYFKHEVQSYTASKEIQCDVEDIYYYTFIKLSNIPFLSQYRFDAVGFLVSLMHPLLDHFCL